MANNTINYQVNFSTNLDNLQSQMKKFATDLGKINPDSASKLDTVIARLEKSFGNLHEKMSKPITSQGQYSAIEREVESITADFRALSKEYAHLASLTREEKLKLLPDDYSKQLASATEALAKFEKEQRRISKMSADISDKSARLASLEKKRTSYSDKISTAESKRRGEQASLYKNDLDAINQQIAALKKLKETQAAYDKAAKSGEKVDRRKKLVSKDGSEYSLAGARTEVKKAFGNTDMAKLDSSELQAEIKRLEGARTETERKIAEPSFSKKEQADLEGYRQVIRDTTSEIDKLTKSIAEDNAAMDSQKTEQTNAAFMELYNTLQGLGVNLDGIDPKLGYTKDGFDLLRQKVEELTDEQLAELNSKLSLSGDAAQQAGIGIRQLGEDSERSGKELEQMADRSSRLGEISTYTRQFLGFTGAINIAHKAISKATNSIKELDKTMTEMAVVTDLDIGDYWNQIPQYTDRANELGVAINDVYKADTLLAQQGRH